MAAVIKENREAGSSTGDTITDTAGTSAENTGTYSGRRGRTGNIGTAQEELPGLVTVADEELKRQERNRKRREKYAENKNKPKKTVKNKDVLDTKDISAIISTVSVMVASRPGMAHWQLTPGEIDKISTPLSNIIGKSGVLSELGEHADAVALVTACFTIFIPRCYISIMQHKQKEAIKNAGSVKLSDQPGKTGEEQKRQDKKDTGRSNGDDATDNKISGDSQLYLGAALY